jgi:hypothetical protein
MHKEKKAHNNSLTLSFRSILSQEIISQDCFAFCEANLVRNKCCSSKNPYSFLPVDVETTAIDLLLPLTIEHPLGVTIII